MFACDRVTRLPRADFPEAVLFGAAGDEPFLVRTERDVCVAFDWQIDNRAADFGVPNFDAGSLSSAARDPATGWVDREKEILAGMRTLQDTVRGLFTINQHRRASRS